MNNSYEGIKKILQKNNPKPDFPDNLTEKIIQQIELKNDKGNDRIIIPLNQKQWEIFLGIRIAAFAATLFLVGYFFFQEWEIRNKPEIKEPAVSFSNITETDPYFKTTRKFKIQQLIKSYLAKHNSGNNKNQVVMVNPKTLNYFLNTIRDLELENKGYRDKFRTLSHDSLILKNHLLILK